MAAHSDAQAEKDALMAQQTASHAAALEAKHRAMEAQAALQASLHTEALEEQMASHSTHVNTLTATHTPVQCMSNFFDAKEGVQPPWSDTYLQMITPQNNHVELLNTMVQEMLTKKEGSISFSKCFVGDAVRISENTETYKNGQEGILTDIKPISVGSSTTGNGGNKRDCRGNGKSGIEFQDRTGCVMLEDGTSVSVKEGHILPAYATTVHRVQGSEYANVALVVFKDTHPNLLSREMIYTSVTRAKEALHVVGNVFVINGCQKMERRTVFDFV